MRNGGLMIPSLMMSFGNGSSQRSTAFDIQKSNLFKGPKRQVMPIDDLNSDQKRELEKTIANYQLTASRQTRTALLLTAALTSLLLLWVF